MSSNQKVISKSSYDKIKPYITKDGSKIRELMHPEIHGNARQSLAEATVPKSTTTSLHRHHNTEEIYYITDGQGRMTLGDQTFKVMVGDTICIPPGTPHRLEHTGKKDLKLLCCCAPPYSHDDTEMMV